MTTFKFNDKDFYIDTRLKEQLDTKIIPELDKKDKDVVFIVDGKERIGKSKFADYLAAYVASQLKTTYDLSNVCMTPEEFRGKIMSCPEKSAIIYDEAHRGMGSRRTLSEINGILVDLMMEMGQKHLFVIVVLPTFFMLDRYPALFRARGLFHIYDKRGERGYWVYYNEDKKLKLFMLGKKLFNYNCMRFPFFRGRFYNQWAVNYDEYVKKKRKSFEEKPRLTKGEVWKSQRDTILYVLNKEFDNMSSIKIAKLMKKYNVPLKDRIIREIIEECSVKYDKLALARGIV